MSLRILFADDSVTAQNMGKKILTEAGYEVVAVSNGAAAVKKIAEQKPDIIILDVYMPGYSGLEVCEKVRASMTTVKTPVLLTVGKMEPYRPEDARRVRADGVIIKPFEASDLLAIVKKFEERISNMPPPLVQAPPPRPVEEIEVQPDHSDHHEPHPSKNVQPTVDVPDHMATSSAFSDLLGNNEHAYAAPPPPPPAVEAVPEPPTQVLESEIPVSWRQDVEPQPIIAETPVAPMITAVPVADNAPLSELHTTPEPVTTPVPVPAPETVAIPEPVVAAEPAPPVAPPPMAASAPPPPPIPVAEAPAVVNASVVTPEPVAVPEPIPTGPVLGRPRQIPVYQEPAPQGIHEVAPTAGPLGDIDIPRELPLQGTAEETARETLADVREPELVSAAQSIEPPAVASATQVMAAPAKAEAAVSQPAPLSDTPVVPRREVSDADFEARVAAALKAYQPASATEASAVAAAVAPPPVVQETAPPAPASAAPSFEYRPPVASAPEPAPFVPEPVVPAAPVIEAKPAIETTPAAAPEPVAEQVRAPEPPPMIEASKTEPVVPNVSQPVVSEPIVSHEAVVARVEESIPAAAAAVAKAAGEHDSIAEAVSRVMERMKGDLVDEIVRELKSKK